MTKGARRKWWKRTHTVVPLPGVESIVGKSGKALLTFYMYGTAKRMCHLRTIESLTDVIQAPFKLLVCPTKTLSAPGACVTGCRQKSQKRATVSEIIRGQGQRAAHT